MNSYVLIISSGNGVFQAAVGPVTRETAAVIAANTDKSIEFLPLTDAAIYLSKMGK